MTYPLSRELKTSTWQYMNWGSDSLGPNQMIVRAFDLLMVVWMLRQSEQTKMLPKCITIPNFNALTLKNNQTQKTSSTTLRHLGKNYFVNLVTVHLKNILCTRSPQCAVWLTPDGGSTVHVLRCVLEQAVATVVILDVVEGDGLEAPPA